MATKSFWLGLVGGVVGIGAAILAILCGGVSSALTGHDSGLYMLGVGAIIFSILGIVSGSMEKKKNIGGALMVISGIAVLICISLFGVLTAVVFVIGGLLLIKEHLDENKIKAATIASAATDGVNQSK